MFTLYLIIGKTASGKDTLTNYMFNNNLVNATRVIPYTTRKRRPNEVEGVDYYFVSDMFFEKCRLSHNILEYRSYETKSGRATYFELKEQLDTDSNKKYVLISTPEAAEKLIEKLGRDCIRIIYIDVPDFVRLQRYCVRESLSSNPNALEICRRMLDEVDDFNEKRMCDLNIDCTIDNMLSTKEIAEYLADFIEYDN